MMNVFSYWSGPKPEWIEVCLATIKKCCKRSKFHLVTPGNWREYAPTLPSRWTELPPGVGTDCLRAALLAQHGGLWIDADTVCLRDPAVILDGRYRDRVFLYSRWTDGRVIAGYVYAPAGHQVAVRWYDAVKSALTYADTIGWGDMGELTLTPIVRGCTDIRTALELPLETFLPINIDNNVEQFFTKEPWREFVTQDTVAFGMNHSWMMHHKPDQMTTMPKDSPLLVHKLMNDARCGKIYVTTPIKFRYPKGVR